MHIPGHMINGPVVPVTNSISALIVTAAAFFAFKSEKKPKAAGFAGVAALIFALQMMNFPIQDGTSGHFIGAVLAVVLLGLPFGILAMGLVLVIQCLIFADGGLSMLGVNILNMAIAGAIIGSIVRFVAFENDERKRFQDFVLLGLGAWVSVVFAAFLCSVELAVSGVIEFSKVAYAMVGTHILIGIGESFITVFAYAVVGAGIRTSSKKIVSYFPIGIALVVGFLLSPFASAFPDGLESVADKFGILPLELPTFVSPIPDYSFPYVQNEFFSTAIAGLIGVVLTFFTVWIIGKLLIGRSESKIRY